MKHLKLITMLVDMDSEVNAAPTSPLLDAYSHSYAELVESSYYWCRARGRDL